MLQHGFKELLERAIGGCQYATQKLLKKYEPLINGHSYLHGKLDEDLKQFIIIHIVKKLPKFKIHYNESM